MLKECSINSLMCFLPSSESGREENPCGVFVQLLCSLKGETPKQLLCKHMQQKRKLKKIDLYVGFTLVRNLFMFLFSMLVGLSAQKKNVSIIFTCICRNSRNYFVQSKQAC